MANTLAIINVPISSSMGTLSNPRNSKYHLFYFSWITNFLLQKSYAAI